MEKLRNNYYKAVTLLGMFLCIAWTLLVNTQPFSDFNYYNNMAIQIANGQSFGDTYTAIGYSMVLGLIYKIFGSNLIVAKTFNIILTLFSYAVVYNILKKNDMVENRRKLIYLLFIIFPNNIFYNSIVGTEILFTYVFLTISLVYYSNIRFKYFLIGVLTGINTMIKPFFIVFFLSIFIIEVFLGIKLGTVLKNTMIILITSLLIISPWIYRNTKLIGQLTFVSNNGGIVLYINNNSQNNCGRWMPAEQVEDSIVSKKDYINANMTEKNEMLTKEAKRWIVAHPFKFIELGFKRIFNTYLIADDIAYSFNGTELNKYYKILLTIYANLIKILVFGPGIIMIFTYSVGAVRNLLKKKNIKLHDLYNIVCFYMFTGIYFITEGQGRYSFPLTFIMVYFLSGLIEKLYSTYHREVQSISSSFSTVNLD